MSDCTQSRIRIAAGAPILGIDVGEDYLDLAIMTDGCLGYHRVALTDLETPPTRSLAARIGDAIGRNVRGGIALVDSPRTPRDVDCSGATMNLRADAPPGRILDASLRELLRVTFNGTMRPLSMFPTPLASYFAGCVADTRCKPHLRAIAEEALAFVIEIPRAPGKAKSLPGGTFTRFMLAGFAAFPALERIGVRAFEAYPDLQMRLWSAGIALPPKRMRAEALRVRRDICARLATIVGIANSRPPATLDEADAAILALSAAASAATDSLIELHCAAEGRFAVALDGATSPHA
ncbi:MAG TPA: hypothetical protein VMT64_02595 [Candidatus Binataceae bacterium]|nr:hypothetical protein [Candidatus Binataceae bacterium]